MQALPLIEVGAADRFAFTDEELALCCSSHNGEPNHVATAELILSRIGLDAGALECGAHWPLDQASAHALVRAGAKPTAVHNNCSGKHAGLLCLANTMGVDRRRYIEEGHPVQREVKASVESLLTVRLEAFAIDGCSIPTFAVPLDRLAYGFARFGTGSGMNRERAAACARLTNACFAHPWHVGGTGRFCTTVLDRLHRRAFVKMGAEGVFGACLPEFGFGIAVKCDDGGSRAADVILAALLARFLPLSQEESVVIGRLIRPPIQTWTGALVGVARPTRTLLDVDLH
jgi:L-asparaginase II